VKKNKGFTDYAGDMPMRQRLSMLARGFKISFNILPGYFTVEACSSVCEAFFPFINLIMSARIVTALVDGRPLNELLFMAAITIIANLITGLARDYLTRIASFKRSNFWQRSNLPLREKIMRMDYEMVEDSETHAKHSEIELLTRVYGRGMFQIINSQVEVFRALFTVIFSISLTVGAFSARASVPAGRWDFVFTVWFALLIILVVIAGILFEIKRVKSRSVRDIAATASRKQIERTASYYVNYIFNYRIGKDLRLYGLAPMISKKISDANLEAANIMRNVWKNNMRYDGIGIFISFVMSTLTYGFVTVKAVFGAFPVGNVVQYIGALTKFTESLRNLSFYGQGLLYDSIAL